MRNPRVVPDSIAGIHTCCSGATTGNATNATCNPLPAAPRIPSLLVWHALFMILAWGVFLNAGIVTGLLKETAILSGKDGKNWFPVHITLNVLGVVLSGIGLILGVLMSKKHAMNLHQIVGLTVSSFAFVQAVLGAARPHKKEQVGKSALARESFAREIWYRVHSTLGILLCLFANVNMFIGVETARLFGVSNLAASLVVALLAMFLLAHVCTFLGPLLLHGRSRRAPQPVDHPHDGL